MLSSLAKATTNGDPNGAFRLATILQSENRYADAFSLHAAVVQLTEGLEKFLVVRMNSVYQLAIIRFDGLHETLPQSHEIGLALMLVVANVSALAYARAATSKWRTFRRT